MILRRESEIAVAVASLERPFSSLSQVHHPVYGCQAMFPFVEDALKAIESEVPDAVEGGFLALGEVVAVNRLGDFRSGIIPEANSEVLEPKQLEEIQRAVQRWIERNPDHPHAGSAFWVLDKFHDDSLLPFLRLWLERYVQRIQPYMRPLGQILVNLNTIEEPSISGESYSAMAHGKNLDDAIRYLNATVRKGRAG